MEVLDLDTKATERIWQSQEPYLEAPVGTVLNERATTPHVSLDDLAILLTRETSRDPPQFHVKRFSAVRPLPLLQIQTPAVLQFGPVQSSCSMCFDTFKSV